MYKGTEKLPEETHWFWVMVTKVPKTTEPIPFPRYIKVVGVGYLTTYEVPFVEEATWFGNEEVCKEHAKRWGFQVCRIKLTHEPAVDP